ncbi:hypothetical protein DPMN_148697 [Dreissena polymorpha]|uniref:Uncharacterized protein n=1 Tax=Dreissena polymorpha TaxID=45954 RepID=A0A9D4FEJ2_DREPO|nr:hypothetical protein DPMN_148697 [Dreissena polymorpha]
MQQLLNKIQASLAELGKFKKSKEANIKSVEGSYCSKLQEIREQRKKLNAALDILENTTLKELDEIRTTLQTSFKKDVDKCTRLKDDLQQLGDAVQGLCDKSKKEMEFIASRKCTDKLQECKSYLKKNHVKVQSSIIFKANIDIEQYLSQQVGLGIMQFFTKEINPYQVLAVKRKSLYNVKIPNEIHQNYITGICSLPNGQLIVADFHNKRLKLLDEDFNVSSHWDVSGSPYGICLITTSEVAVTLGRDSVQFISLTKSWLVNERKLRLPHAAVGIAHHRGKLFITSDIALYHYTLTGTLVKKLYEDTRGGARGKCYVNIYICIYFTYSKYMCIPNKK